MTSNDIKAFAFTTNSQTKHLKPSFENPQPTCIFVGGLKNCRRLFCQNPIAFEIPQAHYKSKRGSARFTNKKLSFSKRSIRAQTLPTAQHELHCRSLLCSILPKSVAPGFCRVSGRCRGGPRLMVCTNLGVLKRSDFICPHSKQLFIFLPGLSNDKGNTSCQITEGIA